MCAELSHLPDDCYVGLDSITQTKRGRTVLRWRSRRTIRINIGVALGLKVMLAIGTVLGLVNLAGAVLLGDMGGSLLVTINALRVARLRPDDVS